MKRKFRNSLQHPHEWLLILIAILLVFAAYSCWELTAFEELSSSEQLEDGSYRESNSYRNHRTITTGNKDGKGLWHGPVEIKYQKINGSSQSVERVNMENGKKEGIAIKERFYPDIGTIIDTIYYKDGREDKTRRISHTQKSTETTAFQILEQEYLCHLIDLNVTGFDNEYVQNYLDTLEKVLDKYEFDEPDFYDNYGEAVDELTYTPYDSIINENADLLIINTLKNTMHSVFRLAVIDRYTTEATSTYHVFETKYPGYLAYLNQHEISNSEFEVYCEEFEKKMDTYVPMSKDDPMYIDSLTWRMTITVIALGETEEPALKSILLNNSNLGKQLRKITTTLSPYASFEDISTWIIYSVLEVMFDSDPISLVVKESWMKKQGIVRLPTVASVYTDNNTLEGTVLEDGGAEVTERGIAWATTYNPTIEENTETTGTGTGSFSITLEGLTEGTTYYARAYATNSAGTAYGSCKEFVAQNPGGPTDVINSKESIPEIHIFPNPATTSTILELTLHSSDHLALSVFNLQGKEVLRKDFGLMEKGKQQIPLELAELNEGTYFVSLIIGEQYITKKLVIAR